MSELEYRVTGVNPYAESLERFGGYTREEDALEAARGLRAQDYRDIRLFKRPRSTRWERFHQSEFPGSAP